MTTRDAFKAAIYTALWTFISTWGASLAGWLQDVTEWATDDTGTVVFPDASALVKAGVAAVVAAFSFVVAFAVRFAQSKGVIGGSKPNYTG